MAGNLPTPQKTWLTATVVNTLTGSDTNNQKDIEIKAKNQRKAWGHTVFGSGNGITGGQDGVDRWNATTDIPNFAVPWIGFTNPATGAQDVIAYTNNGESDWYYAHSPDGGFTGGTSSAAPTAPHQTILYYNSFFGRGDGGSNAQFVCNMWMSTDLTCFRRSYWFNHTNIGNIFYDGIDDPTSGWGAPNYGMFDKHGVSVSISQDCALIGNFVSFPYSGKGLFCGWGPHGAMNMLGHVICAGYGGFSPLPGIAKNKISNTYRLGDARCGLYEPIGNADGGWHGRVFDLWWVQTNLNLFNPGDTLPLDGSKQFVAIGDFMLPWNGGAFRTI